MKDDAPRRNPRCRWSVASPQPLLTERLKGELRISSLLAQCLVNRGYSEPVVTAGFLEPRLKQLADPFLVPHMTAAVERLFRARERAESIVIFGDYDVDGVSSTALLSEVMGALGWTVGRYLPDRFDEGYGLTQEAVENCLRAQPATLLLAVDCGSTAVATIEWLRDRGVEVIVLDHHQVSEPAPAAAALVNPQLAGAGAPSFRELCSVGLAFKLAHAILKRGRETGLPGAETFDLRPLLDLVALGTIADLVPLTGENRILASAGLQRLTTTRRPGLMALKQVAGVEGAVGEYEVGFQLAPRLNAAGRLETATDALELVLAADATQADRLASTLDARNRERQAIERRIADEVIGAVRAKFDPAADYVIVEGQMLWHIGVVGIVASRVLREFYRPTIILGGEADEWRGSGRSIEGFNLASGLRQCDDLLLRHGGHAMAAGLSLRPEKLDALRDRLNRVARQTLSPEHLQPRLRLDGQTSLTELTVAQLEELRRLEPFGQGNPPVQLAIPGISLARPAQRMGRQQQHARLRVTDGTATREVVCWNWEERDLPRGRFDMACAPQLNCFEGQVSVQLKLLDWHTTD